MCALVAPFGVCWRLRCVLVSYQHIDRKVIRWRVLAFLLVMLVTVVPISIYIAKNHKKGHPHS